MPDGDATKAPFIGEPDKWDEFKWRLLFLEGIMMAPLGTVSLCHAYEWLCEKKLTNNIHMCIFASNQHGMQLRWDTVAASVQDVIHVRCPANAGEDEIQSMP